MNDTNPFSHEIWQRIERLVNGDATDEDVRAIEDTLRGNPAAQDLFLEYCQLHLDLAVEVRAEVSAESVLQQVASERLSQATPVATKAGALRIRRPPFSMSLSAMLLVGGCLLTIVGGVLGWRLRGDQRPLDVVAAVPQIAPVAYLVSANGCEWGSRTAQAPFIGSSLGAGDEITLNEGIAEFRLENGVLLSIEGPASMVLASPSSMRLEYGKLTANVRWSPNDVQVHAGALCITASDAEFGLCREDDKIEVHVFTGEVRAESLPEVSALSAHDDTSPARTGEFSSATVPAGNALWLVDVSGTWRLDGAGRNAEPERFAVRLPMAGRLPISADYVNAVLASNPVGYWRFASDTGAVATNEIAGGEELRVEGKLRLTGDTRNAALEFQPGASSYLVTPPLDRLNGNEFSVELWVKPSHAHWGGVLALVASEPAEEQAFYFELLGPRNRQNISLSGKKYPNTVHILHRDPPHSDSSAGVSCFSQAPYRHRRWQHVVATKTSDELRLYIDGELSARAANKSNLAPGVRLVVGRLGTFSYSRKLVGQLDEVAVYNRALTDDEIRGHYRAVVWSPDQEVIELRGGA
jgi:hypothetical protein